MTEEKAYYTVSEMAQQLSLSEATIRRLFADDPTVLKISLPRLGRTGKHKPHVTLRIPAAALERLKQDWARGGAAEVKPRRRRV